MFSHHQSNTCPSLCTATAYQHLQSVPLNLHHLPLKHKIPICVILYEIRYKSLHKIQKNSHHALQISKKTFPAVSSKRLYVHTHFSLLLPTETKTGFYGLNHLSKPFQTQALTHLSHFGLYFCSFHLFQAVSTIPLRPKFLSCLSACFQTVRL